MNNRQRKKRILSYLLSVVLIFTTIPMQLLTVCAQGIDNVVTALTENTTEFTGGNGTEENPYLISNKMHLNNVRKYLDAHFKMVADIEFTEADFAETGSFYNQGVGWHPIGSSLKQFEGVFDGDGHTITGLQVKLSLDYAEKYEVVAGLFGYVCGTIKNLGMVDSKISSTSSYIYAGGITGSLNKGMISNCYNAGTVKAVLNAGGITGIVASSGIISNCYNTGVVTANETAGGIIGHAQNYTENSMITISDCYNTGVVTANETAGGGIAGDIYNITISNCYNTGVIMANSTLYDSYAGGIAGNAKFSTINECYNMGNVTGMKNTSSSASNTIYVGGIVGYAEGDDISECYNVETITAAISFYDKGYEGGIVGFLFNSKLSNSYNVGRVVWGIAGCTNGSSIKNCYYFNHSVKGIGEMVGLNVNDETIACTAEEMMCKNSFAGFDFETIWTMGEDTYPLPVLRNTKRDELSENTTEFSGGTGSIFCPYKITDKIQLHNVRKYPTAFFILEKDLVFSETDFAPNGMFYNEGAGWQPIGSSEEPFEGVFDGNNYSITGLQVNISSRSAVYAGLFGYVRGTIKNLGMVDSKIDATSSHYSAIVHAGGITGYLGNGGIISNCYNTGAVTAIPPSESSLAAYAGGITGTVESSGIISDCYNTGVITANNGAGGIVGETGNDSTISNCYNMGIITSYAWSGGIVGDASGIISNSYNIGAVTTMSVFDAYAGGIAGRAYNTTVSNCYNTGVISAVTSLERKAYVGGITGCINAEERKDSAISNCYNIGILNADASLGDTYTYVGSISGMVRNTADISNCYFLDNILNGVGFGNDKAIKCTPDQMIQQETFAGYDFDTIWTMAGNEDYLYPELQNIPMQFEKELVSIEVSTLPTKTEYLEGKDTLDVTGGQLKLTYNNGTSEVIDLTDDMVTGFDNTKVGKQTLTVTYKGKITTFELEIVAKSLTGIQITKQPNKTTYIEGTAFVSTGMELTLTYNNGTSETITSGWQEEYDFSSSGQKTVTITYGGKKTTLTVTVTAKQITGIAIESKPNKTTYIEGQELDTTGLKLKARYNNGTEETVTGNWKISGYNKNKVGKQTITVTYQGKRTTFEVTVTAKVLTGIQISKQPNKLTYMQGESLNTAGLELTLTFNNGTTQKVTSGFTTSDYDKNKTGKQTITVTYGGKTATFTVTVSSRVPSSITSNVYTVSGGWISKIPAGTTVSTLVNGINEKQYIKVFKGNSEVSGNTIAGTGMGVKLMDGNTVKQSVTIVVTGDTNGDGGITITDMIAVKAHVLKKSTLSGAAAKAADTNGDNGISITDFIQIKADILGKSKIQAR